MITRASDVFGLCRVANERKSLDIARDPDGKNVIGMLGLPAPGRATNAELEALRPAYVDILNRNGAGSSRSPHERIYDILDEAKSEPDAAVLLLYLLQFPDMVYYSRLDVMGLVDCESDEDFPLRAVHKRIGTDKRLARWCRDAIRSDSSSGHNNLVLASSIRLLFASSREKKKGMKLVLQGGSFENEFRNLYNDLAKVVDRPMVSPDAVFYSIHMLAKLARTARGDDHAALNTMTRFRGTPANKSLLSELEGIRTHIGERHYHQVRFLLLGSELSPTECHHATHVPQPKETTPQCLETCSADECTNEGRMTCSRCKLVKYCCKDCQLFHWTSHKAICRKLGREKSSKREDKFSRKIEVAAEKARKAPTPSLLYHNKRLADYPAVDYILIMDSGSDDVGVAFGNPMAKAQFKSFRERAGKGEKSAVYDMYDFLVGPESNQIQSSREKNLLRRQLEAEYCVDPICPSVKGAPSSMTQEEMLAAIMMGGIF